MNELSLFSGIGGGCIASEHLLGHRIIGYVEKNEYCQKLLRTRIDDGLLSNAPIFGDIQTFIDQGCCEIYRGVTDIVSGGFPCQPFSVSGKQKSWKDERNMWPAACEVIKRIKPQYAFLENVPGIISLGYIGDILKDLSLCGYNAKWITMGGFETGCITDGKRLWILAFKADSSMPESMDIQKHIFTSSQESCRRKYTRAISKMLSQDDYTTIKRNHDVITRGMERLRAIGNAQVPIVAATAFRILMDENQSR